MYAKKRRGEEASLLTAILMLNEDALLALVAYLLRLCVDSVDRQAVLQ